MATVFVNIGSNKGNSRLFLSRAMKGIGEEFGPYEISHIVTSPAWGFRSKRDFLNLGLSFQSEAAPEEILDRLLEIQNRISSAPHRNWAGEYTDREIDIDIVAIDDIVLKSPKLTLPHPHLHKRSFFLEPMNELAPQWVHPLLGKTPAEMLAVLNDGKES